LKWKTRKFTLFFTRFARLKKTRKKSLKLLSRNNLTRGKYSKYNYIRGESRLFNKELALINTTLSQGASVPNYLSPSQTLQLSLSHDQYTWLLLSNPMLLKSYMVQSNSSNIPPVISNALNTSLPNNSNLNPHHSFQKRLSKKVLNSFANRKFREDVVPVYQNAIIRFIEFCTGKKAIFQFYPFVNQHIAKDYIVRYKRWLPRMGFYERRLGHRFFLEESLHIIHISFALRDPKIIASWLRAMILRISFWKTRSIFRFLKYLFHNYFIHVFDDVKIKGLKIRLKGKISAAGNSRKRTILYRVGKTSHSEVNLRVVKDFSLVNTFTGVMGFQVYLFY